MQTKTSINFKATKMALKKAGYVMTGWAVANGVSPNSLRAVLSGNYPCPTAPTLIEIVDLLRKQGLLVEEDVTDTKEAA